MRCAAWGESRALRPRPGTARPGRQLSHWLSRASGTVTPGESESELEPYQDSGLPVPSHVGKGHESICLARRTT